MSHHPHLRAYMAGCVFPTFVLPFFIVGFVFGRLIYHVPIPIERFAVFPLALVPILWGAWNVVYLLFAAPRGLPLGIHGAIFFLALAPLAYYLSGAALGFSLPFDLFLKLFPVGLIGYYLLWKYLVGYFNRVLGLA